MLKNAHDKIIKDVTVLNELCLKISVNQKLGTKPKLKQEKIEDGLRQRINKNIAFMDVQAVVAGI